MLEPLRPSDPAGGSSEPTSRVIECSLYKKTKKKKSPVISRKSFIMKQAEVKVLFGFFFFLKWK